MPESHIGSSTIPLTYDFTMFAALVKLTALGSMAGAWSHAVMKDPVPRRAGPAHEELCGPAVAEVLADGMAMACLLILGKLVANYRNRSNRSYRECHKSCRRRLQLRRVLLPRLPV